MLPATSAGAGAGAKSTEETNWKQHVKMLFGMGIYSKGCITQEAERRKEQCQGRRVG